jgi:hypothetical protein
MTRNWEVSRSVGRSCAPQAALSWPTLTGPHCLAVPGTPHQRRSSSPKALSRLAPVVPDRDQHAAERGQQCTLSLIPLTSRRTASSSRASVWRNMRPMARSHRPMHLAKMVSTLEARATSPSKIRSDSRLSCQCPTIFLTFNVSFPVRSTGRFRTFRGHYRIISFLSYSKRSWDNEICIMQEHNTVFRQTRHALVGHRGEHRLYCGKMWRQVSMAAAQPAGGSGRLS